MNAFKKDPALYLFVLIDLLLAGVAAYFIIDTATYWGEPGILAENERTSGIILGTLFGLLTIGGLIFIINTVKDTNLNTRLYNEGLKEYDRVKNMSLDELSEEITKRLESKEYTESVKALSDNVEKLKRENSATEYAIRQKRKMNK